MVAKKIDPEISPDIVVSGLKDVLWRMTGSSDDTPASVMAEMFSLSIGDIERSMYVSDFTPETCSITATKACEDFSLPTPTEVSYLYIALGETACPREAAELCKLRPTDSKPITKDDIPAMSALMDAKKEYQYAAAKVEQFSKQMDELTAQYQDSLGNTLAATSKQLREIRNWYGKDENDT